MGAALRSLKKQLTGSNPDDEPLTPPEMIGRHCIRFDDWEKGDLIRIALLSESKQDCFNDLSTRLREGINSSNAATLLYLKSKTQARYRYHGITTDGKIILKIESVDSSILSPELEEGEIIELDPEPYELYNQRLES